MIRGKKNDIATHWSEGESRRAASLPRPPWTLPSTLSLLPIPPSRPRSPQGGRESGARSVRGFRNCAREFDEGAIDYMVCVCCPPFLALVLLLPYWSHYKSLNIAPCHFTTYHALRANSPLPLIKSLRLGSKVLHLRPISIRENSNIPTQQPQHVPLIITTIVWPRGRVG